MSIIHEIISNRVIQAAAIAWAVAQMLKVILTLAVSKKFDRSRVLGSGGMPSSHSAMACAMVMTIGYRDGFSSSIFALAFCFACVVMYDAMGVRRAAGEQAKVLNRMVLNLKNPNNLFALLNAHPSDEPDEEENLEQKELNEFLGHTPLEVLGGALLGILIAMIVPVF